VIGAFPEATYHHEELQLVPGDTMVLFSDGITEALNAAGEEFGENRVREVVEGVLAESPERVLRAVFDAVQAFARGAAQHDDLTAVVLRFRPSVTGSP
jgi:sigma-B regulation protein RsbU (phosphoserine phosphatase)